MNCDSWEELKTVRNHTGQADREPSRARAAVAGRPDAWNNCTLAQMTFKDRIVFHTGVLSESTSARRTKCLKDCC